MHKQEAEKRTARIYWWNGGSKTLDFNGTLKDLLQIKNIKVRKIGDGYRFRIYLYATSITMDTKDRDYTRCANEAIVTFLCLLGDKTLYESPCGRTYRLNW